MYYFMDGFYNPDDIQGAQSFTAFAYRFDLLKENGWQPAATLDEFTQLCSDMQAKIDDGSLDLDYVIINNKFDQALSKLDAIVQTARCRMTRQAIKNKDLFEQFGIQCCNNP